MKIKKYTILLIAALLGTTACDDYLDLQPEDGTVRQEFWKTKEDVLAAVMGCYSSLLNPPPGVSDRTLAEYLFFYGELRADMIVAGQYASNDQQDISTLNILPTNPMTSWATFYRIINFCNTVIDFAPEVPEADPTFTEEQLQHYLSEALALRAYMYFTLAREFKNVPLKLEATTSDGDNFQIPTSSQEEVFGQVIEDLELAEAYAVEDYGTMAQNKGRITLYAINAMQTDVYLWTDQYEKAVEAADKVINSGKFALIPASDSWFNTVYATGNSTESIFEFQYSEQNLNPFYRLFLQRPEYVSAATVMEDVFGIDFQDDTQKDIRGDRASLVAATLEIYKYTGLNTGQRKSLENSDTHWFLYRYADVLLLKAEALNQLGRGAEALAIIDQVRERSEAIGVTEQNPNPNDRNAITEYILEERAREFAFEGKRWFDVLRNARRNNYERLDLLLSMAATNAPADQQQTILRKFEDPNSHYLPIYQYELYTNKALEQNPFYK